jgi:predicted transcriptional regulator of viral defense system
MNREIKILFRQNNGYLTKQQLLSRYMYYQLLKLVRQGIVTQPKRGVFCFDEEMQNPIDINIETIVPNGVLCLFSAWFHYGLSTTIPHSYYIAIENKRKIVLPDYPPIVLHYWQNNQYDLGISSYTKDGITIKIYDIEKSVCDAIKFRNKVGIDVAAEVLKNYLHRQDRNLVKLSDYAKKMRIEKILRTYLEVEL